MNISRQKAFDFAAGATKQLIGLAIGVLTITITFAKDLLGTVSPAGRLLVVVSWSAYLLSVVFGVWTLLALTGSLEPQSTESQEPSIRGPNVTLPSVLQILTFVIGTAAVVIFGILTYGSQ